VSNAGGVGKNLFKNSDNARSRWMLKSLVMMNLRSVVAVMLLVEEPMLQ